MAIKRIFIIFLMAILFVNLLLPSSSSAKTTSQSSITNLTVEYMENPIGIDAEKPRFSWNMQSTSRGAKQMAYEVFVADSAKNLKTGKYIWSSGKQVSERSVSVKYTGTDKKQLKASTRYYWKVKVWDQSNKVLESKEAAYFETGLMSADGKTNWDGAKWITETPDDTKLPNVTLMRTERNLSRKPIESAQLYMTSLGVYNAYINGQKVKKIQAEGQPVDEIFNPGWTDYKSYVNYQAYDVTPYISNQSKISLGVMLGKGWFAGRIGAVGEYSKGAGKELALLANWL